MLDDPGNKDSIDEHHCLFVPFLTFHLYENTLNDSQYMTESRCDGLHFSIFIRKGVSND